MITLMLDKTHVDAIRKVSYLANNKDSTQKHILLEFEEEKMICIATDGHTMLKSIVDLDETLNGNMSLPYDCFKTISRIKSYPVKIVKENNKLFLSCNSFTSEYYMPYFSNWLDVFPTETNVLGVVSRDCLVNNLKLVKQCRFLKLSFQKNGFLEVLNSKNQDILFTINASDVPDNLSILVDHKYLLNAVSKFPKKRGLIMSVNLSNSLVCLKAYENTSIEGIVALKRF